jgi:tetratricopeptide (TPR) repeat protein
MATATSKLNSGGSTALWIYNPWLDLLIGCGAWSAPLLLFWYLSNTSALAWSIAFYGLALFFNYPHYMATLYRAYHREEDFRKYRIFTVHITVLVLLTLIVSHFWFRALPWLFTIYLTWSPWHYSGQNYGLFMMFARRAGAKPSENERQALYGAFLLSYAILFLSFHTGPSGDPLFISLGLPEKFSTPVVAVLAVAFLGFSVFGLLGLAKQVGWKPLLPALTLFSTQFVWFLLPTAITLAEGLEITQSRYSNGVLAVMHSAQYLWITSYYARREANAEAGSRWRPLAYFGVLMVGGIALFIPGPWLASRIFHYDFTASFLLFTALVNIHHFILDGAIWKLRDGRIAALLLNSREQVSKVASGTGNRLVAGARWLAGESFAPRALRVGAALLLLAWGTLDQAHYYFSLHKDSLADLQRAAALDAFDSSVQVRLGWKEFNDGKTQEAVAAWMKAHRVNPAAPEPRDALLRYLASQRRFEEAYKLASQSLRYTPRDSNLLLNYGVLAQHMGRPQEAVQSWKKAIAVDNSPIAHLYLASELDQEGKLEAAIPQYMALLEQIAKTKAQDQFPPQNVIAVVLRLAQCQQKVNRPEQAKKSYELAQKMAAQVGQSRLESAAAISEAGLESQRKNTAEALRLYQHALTLDRRANDRHSEAADWYSYGLFLRDNGFPAQLAYACLVRSEYLKHSLNDDSELAEITSVRDRIGSTLAAQGAVLRRDPGPALEEALHLTAR